MIYTGASEKAQRDRQPRQADQEAASTDLHELPTCPGLRASAWKMAIFDILLET